MSAVLWRSKRLRGACFSLVALAFGCLGLLGWAGYFQTNPFISVPATRPPAPSRTGLVAIYLSGDVGYKVAMGRVLGSKLAADGIPVLAINSLGFFRNHRSRSDVTRLITQAIGRAVALDHAERVVLIGHSLGADALQAALPGLAPDLRTRIQAVILIVPTDMLYLRISPGEMLGWSKPDGATLPTMQQLDWAPFTCIFGNEETESPCRFLIGRNVERVGLPGGHNLDWDTSAVHAALLQAIDKSRSGSITKSSGDSH